MRYRPLLLLGLGLLLAACSTDPAPSNCNAGAEDTLASALVDGRPLAVSLRAWSDNGIVLISGMGGTVSMIAYCPPGSGSEGMQFWLDGFYGVGAYPVTGDGADSTSMTVYWKGPVDRPRVTYWGDHVTGDTVWVTAFDTLTGAIEGRFSMGGSNGDVQVRVTEGRYQGMVDVYLPGP